MLCTNHVVNILLFSVIPVTAYYMMVPENESISMYAHTISAVIHAIQLMCLWWLYSLCACGGYAAYVPVVAIQLMCLWWLCSLCACGGYTAYVPVVAMQLMCLWWLCSLCACGGYAAYVLVVAMQLMCL